LKMGNRMGTVAEDYKEEYPGLPSYLKCQSSAFVAGTFALLMGGFGTFFTQELVAKYLPWSRKSFLLPALAVGSFASYKVTRLKTTACQEMWIAMEDGRTYLTRLAEEGENVRDFDRKKALDATRDVRVVRHDEDEE